MEAKGYPWQKCKLSTFDIDLDDRMTQSMNSLTDPWQNIHKNQPIRKAWRVNGYRCSLLPDELLGQFHTNDVCLLLAMKQNRKDPKHPYMERNIHVWVGKDAPVQSYQVGLAWSTKLDGVLGRECILYREVQGMESKQFRSYFNPITYLSGHFSDGYWMRRVRNEYQKARLLKLYKPDRKDHQIVAVEVPPSVSQLDPAYTFVLDIGRKLFIWHGNLTPTDEDLKCTRYVEGIKANRGAETQVEALDDDTDTDAHEFFTYLSRATYRHETSHESEEHESSTLHRGATLRRHRTNNDPKQLFKMFMTKDKTTNTDIVKHDLKKEVKFSRSDVDKNAICLVNSVDSAIIVMNKKTSNSQEGAYGFKFAHDFLFTSNTPLKPIIVVRYKEKNKHLDSVLAS